MTMVLAKHNVFLYNNLSEMIFQIRDADCEKRQYGSEHDAKGTTGVAHPGGTRPPLP